MKNALRSLALVATSLCLSAGALHAQTQNVVYGRTTITLNPSFQQAAAGVATLTDLDSKPLINNQIVLKITAGAISTIAAQGELDHSGGIIVTGAGHVVRVQDFIIDSTNLLAPTLTAIMVTDGTYVGRQTLFNIQIPNTFVIPLVPVNSAVQETGLILTLAPTASALINRTLGNVTQAGQSIGTADVLSVFSSSPLTDK